MSQMEGAANLYFVTGYRHLHVHVQAQLFEEVGKVARLERLKLSIRTALQKRI